LPPYEPKKYERDVGADFSIIGSHNGWLRISGARDYAALLYDFASRKTYSGIGWVHGSRVRFSIQSGIGFQCPNKTSPQLINVSDVWLDEIADLTKVVACQGKWVLVDYKHRKRKKTNGKAKTTLSKRKLKTGRAWFRGVCSVQETTCDGVDPDREMKTEQPSPIRRASVFTVKHICTPRNDFRG
jgi:hypothetical protein